MTDATRNLAKIDEVAGHSGLPSYTDLMIAFCDLMDGQAYHDLPRDTGLSDGDCQRVIDVHMALKGLWIETMRG